MEKFYSTLLGRQWWPLLTEKSASLTGNPSTEKLASFTIKIK